MRTVCTAKGTPNEYRAHAMRTLLFSLRVSLAQARSALCVFAANAVPFTVQQNRRLHVENLAWIENQIGIKRLFDRPHHFQFVGIGELLHKFAPFIADSMLTG